MNVRPHVANTVLAALPDVEWHLVQPSLQPFDVARGGILQLAGRPAECIFFPEAGVCSVRHAISGRSAQLALLGRTDCIGVDCALADGASSTSVVAILPTRGWRLGKQALDSLLNDSPFLRRIFFECVYDYLEKVSRNLVMNTHASVLHRVARFLGRAADLADTAVLRISHDDIANDLAVRRAGVSIALQQIEEMQIIRSRRRMIHILDRARLGELVDRAASPDLKLNSGHL